MKQLTLFLSVAIISLSLPLNMVLAQTPVVMPTQTIPPPIDNAQIFGRTIEVDGTRAIAEAERNVYIYEFSNNRWDLESELPLPEGAFVGSVALDGNTAAVQYGTFGSTVLAVFELNNGQWDQVASFDLPSTAIASNFTNPLAVSGTTIVVAARVSDGAANVYERINGVWSFVTELNSPEVESLFPPIFARNLDVNDNTIAIAQRFTGIDGSSNRSVFIYNKFDGTWFLDSRLPITGALIDFGHKFLSLSTDRLIAGIDNGARVFDLVNGNWTEASFFGPNNLMANERIVTVSLDSNGTQAALGTSEERAFLFQLVGDVWIETELRTNNNPLRFGISIGIDGEHLITGSLRAAFYYRLNQTAECIDTDGDGFGWNGTNTCTPTNIPPTTITSPTTPQACLDPDGDGFGWNGFATCDPSEGAAPNDDQQTLMQCIDTDGDGFGWNGFATCDPSEDATPGNNQPIVLQCIDTDGDGFGWDGFATCDPSF